MLSSSWCAGLRGVVYTLQVDDWPEQAADVYARIERSLFGERGLRMAPGKGSAVAVTSNGKDVASLVPLDDGLAVDTSAPKAFREAALAVDGLPETMRRALATRSSNGRAVLHVRLEDVDAAVSLLRAKIAFLGR
jgi:hypothetical protein